MPNSDLNTLVQEMVKAAGNVLKDKWPSVRDYATREFEKLIREFMYIQEMKNQGKITEEHARILIEMHKLAARNVILTSETIGIVAAEKALNAAINIIKDTVNTAIGWTLL